MKLKIRLISTILEVSVILFIGVCVGLYMLERGQTTSDYFNYYGNVTTKARFTSPEEITSFTFGEFVDGDFSPMTFVNTLWCKPIGEDVTAELVSTRVVTFDEYEFLNELPDVGVTPVTTGRAFSNFGTQAYDMIRTTDEYRSWSMGDRFPLESSTCHVNADIITHTPIFKLEKILKFTGNKFEYIVTSE